MELKKLLKSDDWTEKYRPKTLAGVVGHPTAMKELRDWAESWLYEVPKNKCILLYGGPGIGKTTSCHALAHDMGWEVVELNASDQRTAKIIEKIAGAASQMLSLEGIDVKRLIIVDEADNIHGTADRGGEKAIIEVIKKTNQPIILTANELYDMSPILRGSCRTMQFKAISGNTIAGILRNIAEKEGVAYGSGVIEKIVERAGGDLRSAINDLQAISQGKKEGVGKIELSDVITGERDSRESIFKVLGKIFKGTNIKEALQATYDIDEDPSEFIQWIDENLPLEYTKPVDLANAYHYLSRASLFLGRVRRRQNYGMWRYANVLMTSGIVISRSEKYMGYSQFQYPNIRRMFSQTKSARNIRDSVAKKIGMKCHVGMAFVRYHLFGFFRMLMKDERYGVHVAAELNLEPEEIAFLVGSKSITKEVQKIYDESRIYIDKERSHDIDIYGRFGEWKKDIEEKEYVEEKYIEEDQEERDIEKDLKEEADDLKEKADDLKEKSEEKSEKKEEKTQKSLFDF